MEAAVIVRNGEMGVEKWRKKNEKMKGMKGRKEGDEGKKRGEGRLCPRRYPAKV
jgi:hypothetical protein